MYFVFFLYFVLENVENSEVKQNFSMRKVTPIVFLNAICPKFVVFQKFSCYPLVNLHQSSPNKLPNFPQKYFWPIFFLSLFGHALKAEIDWARGNIGTIKLAKTLLLTDFYGRSYRIKEKFLACFLEQ